MPPSRRATQALAQLRHLACLDCSGPELLTPVLQELRHLVGFESSGYFHPGAGGELQAHMEHPAVQAAVPDHFDPRILRSEQQVFFNSLRGADDIARHPHGPHTLGQMLRVPHAGLLRSDYYNVVMRPAGVADWLSLVLRTPRGQALGMLFLFRPAGARHFAQDDLATLRRLQAALARTLAPGPDDDEGEVQQQGLLVLSPDGRLLGLSAQAQALMAQAFGWRWSASASDGPPALRQLLQRLAAAQPDAPLPVLGLRNAAGRFTLHATPLHAAQGPEGAVAVRITRRVPHGTALLAALGERAWPQRQRELAYWLARGLPEPQIAERMGISGNTVVYHRRQLYARLGVASRGGLLAALGSGGV